MDLLAEQFANALTRININGTKAARAVEAHVEVRGYLQLNPKLISWGLRTSLIGSYARHTGIYPGRDVDVFAKLTGLDVSSDPETVFETMCQILVKAYGERATPQSRSVKIAFADDGFSVDVVPAVRLGEIWAIPTHDREKWSDQGARWQPTNPERLTELTTECNKIRLVSGDGAYVPVAKLVRQTRRHHLADRKPGGLYLELATFHAFNAGITGSSHAELFAATLSWIGLALSAGLTIIDPAMGQPYTPAPDPADLANAAVLFGGLAQQASAALDADRCQAAALWRQILGQIPERGWAFPLPPGCDEQGRAVTNIAVNTASGANEARGFGVA